MKSYTYDLLPDHEPSTFRSPLLRRFEDNVHSSAVDNETGTVHLFRAEWQNLNYISLGVVKLAATAIEKVTGYKL